MAGKLECLAVSEQKDSQPCNQAIMIPPTLVPYHANTTHMHTYTYPKSIYQVGPTIILPQY